VLDHHQYDAKSIRTLFDEMASTCGYVNLVSSFGFTARWRHQAVDGLPLETAKCVVDLMSSMGELLAFTFEGATSVGPIWLGCCWAIPIAIGC
jgi:hypothetical protein